MTVFRNSLRQLLRMRGRVVLFFLLLAIASGLCSLGRGFMVINQEKTEAYEDSFMTIGTVEQKADSVRERLIWDAEIQDYHIYNSPVYNSYVPVSVLDFEGADYLSGPEKRCYYGAYMPAYEIYGIGMRFGVVIEGSPVEDAVPDHPIKFKVTKILAGRGILEGNVINFCDHYAPAPQKMYADKTYIMVVVDRPGHESLKEFEGDYVTEYGPDELLGSTQVDAAGQKAPDEIPEEHYYDEVTEGFYESPRGKRWLNLIDSWKYAQHTFPVTGTNDIHLMMAFYNGSAYISSGREFTEEEYEQGERVCLVSELFADKNGLKLGDKLPLSLYYANYESTPGDDYGSHFVRLPTILNAKGEVYPVFEEGDYEIVGFYGGMSGVGDEYGMGYHEIIIPSRSVKNSDADNILACGPMAGNTTSFRIANGTIDEYMEKWSRQGISNVEITFYDGGYTQLEASIHNMKYIARLLLVMGVVMVLLVLGYFTWLFILRQGDRTAIERSLGLSERKCFASLFLGIFLILLLGSVSGSAAGTYLSGGIVEGIGDRSYYDRSFGNSAAADGEKTAETGREDSGRQGITQRNAEEENMKQDYPVKAAAECALAVILAGTVIASIGISRNLGKEPMQMFAGR